MLPGDPEGRGNKGAYIFAEHRLTGIRTDDPAGLAGWLRYGIADERYNRIGSYLGGGLVHTGLGRSRKDDQIGLSFAATGFGDRYRRAQQLAAIPGERREIVVEAVYNTILAPWLSVQPDVQYVVNPGGDPRLDDAIVIGLRIKAGR